MKLFQLEIAITDEANLSRILQNLSDLFWSRGQGFNKKDINSNVITDSNQKIIGTWTVTNK